MNPLNTANQTGRIPSTDKIPFIFKEGDEPKNNFFSFMISVRRAYKPKDAQYYEEDLIPVKAWGGAAVCGSWIKRGDTVSVVGELRRGNDWEDDNGQTHRGQLEIVADKITKISGSKNDDEEGNTEEAPAKATPKASGAKSSLKARLMNKKAGGHI